MFMTCYLTCHSLWLATEAVAVAKGVATVAESYLHFAMAIGSESSLVVICCWTVRRDWPDGQELAVYLSVPC